MREVLARRGQLLGLALRLARNRADAEDLVQDTLVRALEAWSRFEPGTNCRAWLSRILTNCFITSYRRGKRRGGSEVRDEVAAALYATSSLPRPDDALLGDALGDEVTRALDSLGPEFRKVVELADLAEQPYREVAAALEVPIGTVMSRLFRARQKLRADLAGYAERDYGICRAA